MLHTKYLSSWSSSLCQEDFLSFSFRLPWQPEFCMELISLNNFRRGPCKDHSCEVSLKSHRWYYRRRWFCNLLTYDGRTTDGRRTTAHRISPSGLWPVELKIIKYFLRQILLIFLTTKCSSKGFFLFHQQLLLLFLYKFYLFVAGQIIFYFHVDAYICSDP